MNKLSLLTAEDVAILRHIIRRIIETRPIVPLHRQPIERQVENIMNLIDRDLLVISFGEDEESSGSALARFLDGQRIGVRLLLTAAGRRAIGVEEGDEPVAFRDEYTVGRA